MGVATAQSAGLAITHVSIINPGIAHTQTNMTILIEGSDIILVGKSEVVKVPASVETIDATGEFVIPGLWDMHTHFRDAARDLKMDLANGVLGIRNFDFALRRPNGMASLRFRDTSRIRHSCVRK